MIKFSTKVEGDSVGQNKKCLMISLTCAMVEPAIKADPSGKSAKARADSNVIPDAECLRTRSREVRRDFLRRRVAKRGADDDSSSLVVARKKCLELCDKLYTSGGLEKELTRYQLWDV
jgi:hypothetical protein